MLLGRHRDVRWSEDSLALEDGKGLEEEASLEQNERPNFLSGEEVYVTKVEVETL